MDTYWQDFRYALALLHGSNPARICRSAGCPHAATATDFGIPSWVILLSIRQAINTSIPCMRPRASDSAEHSAQEE